MSLRATGRIRSRAGKAINQEIAQEPIQIDRRSSAQPRLLRVLIRDTMQVIKQERIKGITNAAYRGGNFRMAPAGLKEFIGDPSAGDPS
ncbi:MAG: hypothetical protein ACJAWL_000919 [Motiliproteus sp.]